MNGRYWFVKGNKVVMYKSPERIGMFHATSLPAGRRHKSLIAFLLPGTSVQSCRINIFQQYFNLISAIRTFATCINI
jgi:hypothetical protein